MAEKNIKAKAKVRVLIEIDCPSWWSDSTGVDQVFRQAGHESVEGLKNALAAGAARRDISFRIIGEPTVEAVLTEYV